MQRDSFAKVSTIGLRSPNSNVEVGGGLFHVARFQFVAVGDADLAYAVHHFPVGRFADEQALGLDGEPNGRAAEYQADQRDGATIEDGIARQLAHFDELAMRFVPVRSRVRTGLVGMSTR